MLPDERPYEPIACMRHEQLEFAVLRRQWLQLTLQAPDGSTQVLTVLPTDVTTRNQAEWLTYRSLAPSGTTDETTEVRLDHIVTFAVLA